MRLLKAYVFIYTVCSQLILYRVVGAIIPTELLTL